jgi:uncharacterized protein (TIGR03083 family)
MMSSGLEALGNSVADLDTLVSQLSADQLTQPAYPTEWSIADTLSHIGSGAVIFTRAVEDVVHGRVSDSDFNQSVWDQWNAKSPSEQAADSLVADAAMLEMLKGLNEAQRSAFKIALGPFEMDFSSYLGMRLSEHLVHTWDIQIAVDSDAIIPVEAWESTVATLAITAGFAGKSTGSQRSIHITTSEPAQGVTLELKPESVELTPSDPVSSPELTLPAEALVRLVYGRLDPNHTPPGVETELLEELRGVFPGF